MVSGDILLEIVPFMKTISVLNHLWLCFSWLSQKVEYSMHVTLAAKKILSVLSFVGDRKWIFFDLFTQLHVFMKVNCGVVAYLVVQYILRKYRDIFLSALS